LTITSSGLVNEFLFSARGLQNGQLGGAGETITIASSPVTTAVSLTNLRPGAFEFSVTAEATNMVAHAASFSLGLSKPNSPPVVSVAVNFDGENASWDESQLKFEMFGLVSDPDLEAVTMSLTICGADYQGFTIDGINWVVEVSTAICLANGLSNYDVMITAVDESGASTQLAVGIPAPVVDETPDVSAPVETPDEALPSLSFLATMSMLGVAVLHRRKVDE
jgi:hypothetical protein